MTAFPIPVGGPHESVLAALEMGVAKVVPRLVSGELKTFELRCVVRDHECPDDHAWPVNVRGRHVLLGVQLDEATRTRLEKDEQGWKWHVRAVYDVVVRDELVPGQPKPRTQRQSDAFTEAVRYIQESLDPQAVADVARNGSVGAHGLCALRHAVGYVDQRFVYDVAAEVVAECRRRVREGVNFRVAKPDEETFERPNGFSRDEHETLPATSLPAPTEKGRQLAERYTSTEGGR